MSRAFNIPNHNHRYNIDGDTSLLKNLLATLLTLLEQRQVCRRNCCLRYHPNNYRNVRHNQHIHLFQMLC